MFLCLLQVFVFFMASLVVSFRYMSSPGDLSKSAVREEGRTLCTESGVMSGELAKYCLSFICRLDYVISLCTSYSRNLLDLSEPD